ncbi:bleomycin resistance protein [Zhouia sp. PK063]|uniref:bleomycin resistance protein n=1 Tax=Zhouia sp. PK063 TaxID=3373602 RepID=UPI003788619D
MLTAIHPKLPMRNKKVTTAFYVDQLGFDIFGNQDYPGYLMIEKDHIQLHFFEFKDLNPKENYGQVYIRTNNIYNLYQAFIENEVAIHPNGALQLKPWGQKEFSILDPDYNLLTFGESFL